jgi:hypothetical protein
MPTGHTSTGWGLFTKPKNIKNMILIITFNKYLINNITGKMTDKIN